MTKAAKRKAPSRIKYEQSHPTVSCRVSREIYDVLQKTKEAEGKSFADVLKVGLRMIEATGNREREIARLGFVEGHKQGYAEAQRLYKVTYPCSICSKTIEVTSEKAKQAASQYMVEHNWGHSACRERER